MSDIAIKVEGLSKRYRIGALQQQQYRTLREALNEKAFAPFRAAKHLLTRNGNGNGNPQSAIRNSASDVIWALKDVSFEVKQGEVLGIIGRNGAGKSTLLKILSRITEPTDGYADITGRLASLLEVGTGFHPELTGRENIFLNGSILGMRRTEIHSKFNEIVAFAEVEKFIDTPVKYYSSGMYVRLAFAVAAHLDPDILLMDEVLAVGDAAFQKKCLGKMGDVAREGRTVLFVSHNMASISRLCPRTVLLDAGNVMHDGPSHQVINTYLRSGFGTSGRREYEDHSTAPGNEIVRLKAARVRAHDGKVTDVIDIREEVHLEMEYDVLKAGHVLVPNFHCYNDEGICVFIIAEFHNEWHQKPRPAGHYRSTVRIPGNFLAEGTIVVNAAISTYEPFVVHFHENDVIAFQVVDSLDGNSARGDYAGHYPGVVRPLMTWKTELEERSHFVI